ncbi:restriction endonuclease subunit S [Hydrotalea sp.]|uniref:restriction endonuclease subunit S n=1 Tax=Hydrotalea sp. TaxID=2881279 RepID=UPI00259125AE|nr:restriction endonuclease subunit S [Hydrotalea sp.]
MTFDKLKSQEGPQKTKADAPSRTWEIKKLGEVSEILNGGTPKTNIAEYWDGDIHWITPADLGKLTKPTVNNTPRKISRLGLEKSSAKLFPEYSVILSTRAPIGHLAINEVPMSTNQGCRGIVPSKKLDTWFLYYFLKKNVDLLDSLGTGATFKELSTKALAGIEIPLPPLPEQQRIVSILDECFAAIAKAKANAEQNLKNAKELFESYLQGVFEKKGDGWEEKMLEELADENCTLSYGIVQPGEEFENGLPVIRPTDLTSRYIKVEGLKKIDPKLADGYKRTKLIGDELFLCVRGTTGVVSIATPELKDANVTRGIVPIRFNSKIINQEFGYYLLISNYVQKQIRAKTYGAALMQINIGDLRKILTPYPSLKEQKTIVRQLDALRAETQKLEALYQKKIHDLEELKKSILQKAFAGELKMDSVKVAQIA